MIYGIGVDIVEVERFRNIIKRRDDKFAKKVLSDKEYNTYLKSNNKETYLSKCWAVKEAFVKAMGTGFTGIYKKADISYCSSDNSRPFIELSNDIENEIKNLNININLSVSDEVSNAIAFVVLESL
jgi:holo-[acyl-carrier protein] synthase